MKTLAFHLACLVLASSALAQGFGDSQPIRHWRFHLGDDVQIANLEPEGSAWRDVIVPHDWSVEYPASPDNASCTGYLPGGVGWYQTDLDIPRGAEGQRYYLYFEGVYNRSEVFVNGASVGYRPNGYISFLYDITSHVEPGETASVAVRVDHSLSADSRWYTGSGIYRPVSLVVANPVHFAQWGVRYWTEMDGNRAATVVVETSLEDHRAAAAGETKPEVTITQELRGPDGSLVARKAFPAGADNAALCKLQVPEPQLWSVRSPTLYTLRSTASVGGQVIDATETKVGIRALSFDPDRGFALNGEWMKIKGVCLHHDGGATGSAVPKEVWRQRLLQLKKIGCNGIRMSHNPQATDLYDLCDELGFLVMDEAFDEWEYPKKKWIEGWNIGTPGFQGSADFFEEWAERDLADMVRRDRNHPSIIMWSIGNEVDYPNDPYSHPILDKEGIDQQHTAGYRKDQPSAERLGAIAKRLAAVVRQHDTSRPVTAALAGAVMSNETEYPAALDVVGYNYTERRYKMDHEKYPDRVLYGSENRHDIGAWKAVADNDFIFAQFIWTGIDYLGESNAWPSRGFGSGMIDFANNIKPRGYFRQALWSEQPVAYLGTYPIRDGNNSPERLSIDAGRSWNYKEGQMTRVVCYTNGDEAELLLDGKLIGPRKPYDPDTAIIHWDVPYRAGALEVVAYQDGKRVATDSIHPDRPAKELKADMSETRMDKPYDVAVIPLTVVDEQGQLVYEASNEVSCSISGPARLLGLENASQDARENQRDATAPANNGRLVAYVQALGEGTITVTLSSPGLQPATAEFQVSP